MPCWCVCVCARLYLQFKLQNLWVLGCSSKISGAEPVLCRFRPLISNFPATGQCHKLLLSPLNQNGMGVHFVTGRRHSNSVLSSYCNHMCQLATCGVYTVDSEISLYGLHYPLEYDLLVRFKVKAATKTGSHLNYNL